MCGIMGYTGSRPAVDVLLKGLKKLEYRGYDSAGIAYFLQNKIEIKKSEGKLQNIEKIFPTEKKIDSVCGIGHTRWATHGKPTTQNAHPHRTGSIVLVHNGIIENYQEIKEKMILQGHIPQSETDSELFGFLVLEEMKKTPSFAEAVRKAFNLLEGSCSVVVLNENEPGSVIGIRNGSPLVAALDPQGGVFFASDAQPIIEYTKNVFFLENGDMAVASSKGIHFIDFKSGKKIERFQTELDWDADTIDKKGYAHYMLKEIYEQPQTMVDTFNSILDRAHTDPFPLAEHPGVAILKNAKELIIVACGTSLNAGILGRYWLERWAGIPVSIEFASEFRYRDPVLNHGVVIIGISQSGETADTLAVIREMRSRSIPCVAITNARGSSISREAHATFFTSAGPEIGVAATKTFTAQMTMLLLWAGFLGLARGKDTSRKVVELFDEVLKLPHLLEASLQHPEGIPFHTERVAQKVADHLGFFFIGRGYSYPIALEGALKLKEIAYVHAEGYAAGELKHGPIAMIDQKMVVVVIAPKDHWHEKSISNLQEVKARGAFIIGIGDSAASNFKSQCDEWIPILPHLKLSERYEESLYPFFTTVAVQLLSYHVALLKKTDIDQPRNLAKSVTVE